MVQRHHHRFRLDVGTSERALKPERQCCTTVKTQAWGECVWMFIYLCMYTYTLRLSFETVLCKRTPWLTFAECDRTSELVT